MKIGNPNLVTQLSETDVEPEDPIPNVLDQISNTKELFFESFDFQIKNKLKSKFNGEMSAKEEKGRYFQVIGPKCLSHCEFKSKELEEEPIVEEPEEFNRNKLIIPERNNLLHTFSTVNSKKSSLTMRNYYDSQSFGVIHAEDEFYRYNRENNILDTFISKERDHTEINSKKEVSFIKKKKGEL